MGERYKFSEPETPFQISCFVQNYGGCIVYRSDKVVEKESTERGRESSKKKMTRKVSQKKKDILNEYRRILGNPDLSNKKVEEMRKNLRLIAQTICEHVWGKKFY